MIKRRTCSLQETNGNKRGEECLAYRLIARRNLRSVAMICAAQKSDIKIK